MMPGSLIRFHARFELPNAGDLVRLRSLSEGRGHLLGAVGIAGEAGRALVFVSDAAALQDEASGAPASLVIPYLVAVWSPLLQLVLGCPAARVRWVFQDESGRLSVAETVSGGAIAWEQREDVRGIHGVEGLGRLDPQLTPMLLQVLALGADEPATGSGPWPPLVQSPPLNVRGGGSDWVA